MYFAISYDRRNRVQMLYAASRSVLSKNLGDQKIKDSLFATAKVLDKNSSSLHAAYMHHNEADLTPEAYLAHVRSSSAPKPMSDREIEEEAVKTAERNTNISSNQSRVTSRIGSTVGCIWSQEVIDAVSSLANPSLETSNLVVIVSQRTTGTHCALTFSLADDRYTNGDIDASRTPYGLLRRVTQYLAQE